MLRANNLTICIPTDNRCNKNCAYCVSRMTRPPECDRLRMSRNLEKVRRLAVATGVSDVLLTGRGEPLLAYADPAERGFLERLHETFREWPLSLQTNGLLLLTGVRENTGLAERLYAWGLDTVALSLDAVHEFELFEDVIARLKATGFTVRICLNVTDKIPGGFGFDQMVEHCRRFGADQFLMRNITAPSQVGEGEAAQETARWIEANTRASRWERLNDEAQKALAERGILRRTLNFGLRIYEYAGLSVSISDYCIQDESREEDVRSLIFDQDGHVYTAWNSEATRLL
jgi:hypothetical protein